MGTAVTPPKVVAQHKQGGRYKAHGSSAKLAAVTAIIPQVLNLSGRVDSSLPTDKAPSPPLPEHPPKANERPYLTFHLVKLDGNMKLWGNRKSK